MYKLLRSSHFYSIFNSILGGTDLRKSIVREAQISPGARVLDVGSGTSRILECLPTVSYLGLEPSAAYVERARKTYPYPEAEFRQGSIGDMRQLSDSFDVVMALGVLHHVPDDAVNDFFRAAVGLLRPGGQIITLDPATWSGMPSLARYFVSKDRGKHVRPAEVLRELMVEALPGAGMQSTFYEFSGTLRIPYAHLYSRHQLDSR